MKYITHALLGMSLLGVVACSEKEPAPTPEKTAEVEIPMSAEPAEPTGVMNAEPVAEPTEPEAQAQPVGDAPTAEPSSQASPEASTTPDGAGGEGEPAQGAN